MKSLDPPVRLKCGCIDTKFGAIRQIGERSWYQACINHGIQKIIKEYQSAYDLWKDMENARDHPVLF